MSSATSLPEARSTMCATDPPHGDQVVRENAAQKIQVGPAHSAPLPCPVQLPNSLVENISRPSDSPRTSRSGIERLNTVERGLLTCAMTVAKSNLSLDRQSRMPNTATSPQLLLRQTQKEAIYLGLLITQRGGVHLQPLRRIGNVLALLPAEQEEMTFPPLAPAHLAPTTPGLLNEMATKCHRKSGSRDGRSASSLVTLARKQPR